VFLGSALVLTGAPASAAPTIVSRGAATEVAYDSEATRSIDLNVPSGAQAGDVLVAAIGIGRSGASQQATLTAPPGWTLANRTNQGTSEALAVYWHVHASGESRHTWTTNVSVGGTAFLAAFGGVDRTNPVNAVAGRSQTTASPSVATPSITTTVADTVLVAAFYGYDSGGPGSSWSTPSGMAELGDVNNGGSRSGALDSQAQAAATATGGRTATTTRYQDIAVATLLALSPASGGSQAPPPPPPPSGTITSRGAASKVSFGSESTKTLAIDVPGNAQAGDVLIAAIAFGRSGASQQPTLTAPPGWALVNRTNQGSVGALALYWHVHAAGETRHTWTTNVNVGGTAFIAAFGGVDRTNPVNAVAGRVQTKHSKQVSTASVTTTVANTVLVAAYYGYDGGGRGSTWAPPSGMTELGDGHNASSRSGTVDQQSRAATGATGARTASASTTQDAAVATLLALRPGTTDTPPPADTQPPTISGIGSGTPGTTSATITWSTSEAADSQVEYGYTTGYGGLSTLDARLTSAHVVPLANLVADKTYHFRVRSRDAAGNLAISADSTFRTAVADGGGGAIPLIVDTDIFSDADDVGALATAFGLQLRGEARVIAIGVNTRTSRPSVATNSWRCAAAVAQFYGSGSVPIGTHKPDNGTETNTDEFIGPCSTRAAANTPTPDTAVRVFRRALAGQPDGSVAMVEAGYDGNLSDLLDSPADAISPLTGRQLIAQKVNVLVVMGGGYPSRNGENNLQGDIAAAQNVADNWPSRIVWSGYEVGDLIHTGSTISSRHPSTSPVRISYEAFVGPNKWIYSYDLTAVYHAIRPNDPSMSLVGPGRNTVTSTGGNRFTTGSGNQWYLRLNNATNLSNSIDALLVTLP
jgi:hypothetical protein